MTAKVILFIGPTLASFLLSLAAMATPATVADLEGVPNILSKHVAEAVHYRSLDRTYWS